MTDQPAPRRFAFATSDAASTKNMTLMAEIRSAEPVCRPADGLVLTTRWQDTRETFRDITRFSSVGDMRAPGVTVPVEESFLGELDAPLHPKIRRVLMPWFTLRAAREAEAWTRATVRERLARFKECGGGDLMQALAIPLPGSVSAHVLGVPDAMHQQLMTWCDEVLHSTWPTHGRTDRGEGIAGAFPEFAAVLDEMIAQRQEAGFEGADDLLSAMVRARDKDGWQIGAHHIRTLVVNILSGSLSASYMLGNLAYRLVSNAAFQEALRADPGAIAGAVEESLRYEAPVTFLFRTALQDAEIGGCPVRKGEHVMLGIAAANRDPAKFDDPDSFRIDRANADENLSFGFGAHLCIGNHLTRMIGRVVIEEMLAAFPTGTVSLAPGFVWRCVAHDLEYGPESLELVVSA